MVSFTKEKAYGNALIDELLLPIETDGNIIVWILPNTHNLTTWHYNHFINAISWALIHILSLRILKPLSVCTRLYVKALECGKTRLEETHLLGFAGVHGINICFYVQHYTNVLHILVCCIFMPSKFHMVINKTLLLNKT